MASTLNTAALTLNAKESADFSKFVVEQVFSRPELKQIHDVVTGVTMKEQIVLAGQLGKTGLLGNSVGARKASGATSTLTEKFWEPAGIEDTIINDNAAMNALFKAYFDKITSYKEKYDITGTDEEVFLSILVEEAVNATIPRAIWLADKGVTAGASGSAGLGATADKVFYNYFDGLWAQIFDGVGATTISKVAISENAKTTPAAQLGLTGGRAEELFEEVYAAADPRLKSDPTKEILVSGAIFENYTKSLRSSSQNFTIDYTMNGLQSVKWNGIPVINMETIWDVNLQADFIQDTNTTGYYLPNRIVFTTPANIPVGTLNEDDFTELESWYEKNERLYNIAYGFSLDAKVIQENMIVVAY